MSKPKWLRGVIVPVGILSILFVAFVAYYMYWVPSRQRQLDDRSFRYLKTLSDQIRLSINTYDRIMDNAVDSGIIVPSKDRKTLDKDATQKNLEMFLKNVAPQLGVADQAEATSVVGDNYDDPPKVAVRADEGTHFLYLAFTHDLEDHGITGQEKFKFAVRTDLDQETNRLLGAPELSPFDVVLIAQSDGTVIFQKSLSGVEVAQIKGLEDASVSTKGQDKRQFDINWFSPTSRQEEIWIAGARYRLFSQPLQIGFLPAHPTANHSSDAAEAWVLCGLVRADRFRSESQQIPYSYILMMLGAILLAAASYPFLKLYLSSPGERLRKREVTVVAIFACIIAAVLTFMLADVYFWNNFFGPAAERDMAKIAHAMNANFKVEQDAAFAALDEMTATEELRSALRQSQNESSHVTYNGTDGTCEPPWACRVNMLSEEKLADQIKTYPYGFYAYWSDSKGQQRIKWTTRKRPTPFILLDDHSTPYYPELKRALKRQVDSASTPTQGIGSVYSSTTGQNTTVFWKVISGANDATSQKTDGPNEKRYAASLVTQPISVYNAVLPGGYQFAVLAPDGTVVFHSDTTRNLRENFLAEAGQNPDLRSRVHMRSEGAVTADYMGRQHRMYVMPMAAGNQDGLWTIVVFRDLHLEEVLNLEILSLVTILFLLYAAAIIVVMVVVHRIRRGKVAEWFWPDSLKAPQYRRIAIIGAIAAVLLLLLSRFLPSVGLLFSAATIPAVVLSWAAIVVGRRGDEEAPASEQDPMNQWQSAYFQAAGVLVILVAVLPCLCFFKVTADYGQWLLAKRNLLQLASDLDNRALAIQSLYQDVKLGVFQSQILAAADSQHARQLEAGAPPTRGSVPVFSYHELLDTDISNAPTNGGSAADPSDDSSLMSALSYPYNESAADDRHLAEGKSDVWKWSSSGSGRDRTLKLTNLSTGGQVRSISVVWRPFQFPWGHWLWLLETAIFFAAVYGLVRLSFARMFLLDLVVPPPLKDTNVELNPASLMADLPMSLLLIGPESCRPIASLIHRADVQVHEIDELFLAAQSVSSAAPADAPLTPGPVDAIIRDGRPLVLRDFESLPDNAETVSKVFTVLMKVISTLGNSVIIVSSQDPVMNPAIESSDRWRQLLRSFVRVDLHSTPRQRRDEDDADYQNRISANSYFHWLFSGLPRNQKLVMMQLAKEKVVNPNSNEIVSELLEQGLIERRHGLLSVTDTGFKHFLHNALPRHTVKLWEKEIAGARPFSLQTSLLIVGVGVVAFLIYTQGDVFNTWVTYATGVAAALPKVVQLFESVQSKPTAKS